MGTKKLAKGMVIGALVGGAITLFDRETRKDVIRAGKTVGNKVLHVISNPGKTWHGLQEKVNEFQSAYRELNEDIRLIMEKAQEIKEVSLETKELLRETKEVFLEDKSEETPNETESG